MEGYNTLVGLLPLGSTDEVQSVDTGDRRLVKLEVGKGLEAWYEEGNNVETWHPTKLSSSNRKVLLTHWVGEAVTELDANQQCRRRFFERLGLP